MKQLIMITLISVAAAALAFGNDGKTDPGIVSDEAAARQLLSDVASALTKSDADALEKLYADDFTLINPMGILMTKSQSLGGIRSKAVKFETFVHDDLKIRIYQNSAVATALVRVTGTNNGKDMATTSRNTMVLVKINGKWRLAATQATATAAD